MPRSARQKRPRRGSGRGWRRRACRARPATAGARWRGRWRSGRASVSSTAPLGDLGGEEQRAIAHVRMKGAAMSDEDHPNKGPAIIAAAIVGAALILSWGNSQSEPRYQIASSGDGVVRMDTDSGELIAC